MLDNYDISWDQTTDPAALNTSPETYMAVTRDPERTPFQWNSDQNAGNDVPIPKRDGQNSLIIGNA